jgi:hypothetical protein
MCYIEGGGMRNRYKAAFIQKTEKEVRKVHKKMINRGEREKNIKSKAVKNKKEVSKQTLEALF